MLVTFELPGDEDEAADAVEAPLAAVASLQKQHPEVLLGEFGDASAEKQIGKAFEEDFKKAEFLSLPITLLILLIAFGALVAAGLPLLLGATAVMGTIGLLGPISQLHALDESSSSVVLLVGLAVGVDYCMFYLRREMEERDAGADLGRGAERRRRDVGPRRPHLGSHGHGRDGRHVPRRQPGLRLVRHRHDHRRRRRDDRLGHGAPGDALVPVAQGLDGEGPRALHRQAAPQDPRRVPGLGRDPRPRPQAPAALRGAGRRPAGRADHPRVLDAHGQPGRDRAAAQPRGDADVRQDRRRVPRRRRAGRDRDQGARRHHPGGAGGDRGPQADGDRHGRARRADERRDQPGQDGGRRVDGGQGHRDRRRVRAVARGPARPGDSRDGGAVARRRGRM